MKVTICGAVGELSVDWGLMNEEAYGHEYATDADVGRKAFSYPRKLPEHAEEAAPLSAITLRRPTREDEHVLVFPRVNHARDDLADVSACADEEEDAQKESVEVE
jgi:hypothetical protein